MDLKVDHNLRGKWFIHGPKHHKENQLLSLEHSNPFFEKESPWTETS